MGCQVIPIIAICGTGLLLKIFVILCLGLKKDDVWFTRNSGRCEVFETRRGRWYKVKSRKWGGRDDYPVPAGALLAQQGYADGPSFEEDKDDSGSYFTPKVIAAHVAVTTAAIAAASLLL